MSESWGTGALDGLGSGGGNHSYIFLVNQMEQQTGMTGGFI
jgi:hypothetical protein